MVTMAQRITQLRDEKGLSRPALAAALKLPKNAVEKFETGRQSPTKEQVQALADFFGVSVCYLRGESGDRTRQDLWLETAPAVKDEPPAPAPARKKAAPASGGRLRRGGGRVFEKQSVSGHGPLHGAGGPALPGGAGGHRQSRAAGAGGGLMSGPWKKVGNLWKKLPAGAVQIGWPMLQ